jgi:3-methyladenine DNA glycosylase AlkD
MAAPANPNTGRSSRRKEAQTSRFLQMSTVKSQSLLTSTLRSAATEDGSAATNSEEIIAELHRLANPKNVAGMARFGITGKTVLGISMGQLRVIARRFGRNHALAGVLWSSGILEARLLAAFVAEPDRLTWRQANSWARDFECWADCDALCIHLFRKVPFAHKLAVACSQRKNEFVKRTGFTLMATLAVHDKTDSEKVFRNYLSRIEKAANDERNGVKKAVNWALRQIGKRDPELRDAALRTAESIRRQGTCAARWIASDARRELVRIRFPRGTTAAKAGRRRPKAA